MGKWSEKSNESNAMSTCNKTCASSFNILHNCFVNTLYKSYGKTESQESRVPLTRCNYLLDFENCNII